MKESNHTAEPWQYRRSQLFVNDHEGRFVIGECNTNFPELSVANARRIVACVNACAGISTENLEDNKPIIELANDYNAVLKQRNELLAVVEHIRRCVPYVGFVQIHAGSKTVADMDAVIAKVRGDAE